MFGLHAAFSAAFPWFDDYRWAWVYDPDGEGAPAYRIRPAAPGARGTIGISMPTATHAGRGRDGVALSRVPTDVRSACNVVADGDGRPITYEQPGAATFDDLVGLRA